MMGHQEAPGGGQAPAKTALWESFLHISLEGIRMVKKRLLEAFSL